MNYQCHYGTMTQVMWTLFAEGGWTRYSQGLTAALIPGPVLRFGDTPANVGLLALLKLNKYLKDPPLVAESVSRSSNRGGFGWSPVQEAQLRPYRTLPLLRKFVTAGSCSRAHLGYLARRSWILCYGTRRGVRGRSAAWTLNENLCDAREELYRCWRRRRIQDCSDVSDFGMWPRFALTSLTHPIGCSGLGRLSSSDLSPYGRFGAWFCA